MNEKTSVLSHAESFTMLIRLIGSLVGIVALQLMDNTCSKATLRIVQINDRDQLHHSNMVHWPDRLCLEIRYCGAEVTEMEENLHRFHGFYRTVFYCDASF